MMIALGFSFTVAAVFALWLTMPDDLQIDESIERDDYEA